MEDTRKYQDAICGFTKANPIPAIEAAIYLGRIVDVIAFIQMADNGKQLEAKYFPYLRKHYGDFAQYERYVVATIENWENILTKGMNNEAYII